jgi:Reverse transcriptase (RNA-dependent DNA polymerase)
MSDPEGEHPFGCPAYVLDSQLQSGKTIPKWESRSRLGIYLGPSLQHARSVGLVLSLSTGMVSPQFHVRYDDEFETTTGKPITLPKSEWQTKCGFATPLPTVPARSDPMELGTIPVNAGVPEPPQVVQEDMVIDQESMVEHTEPIAATEGAETPPVRLRTRSGREIQAPARFDDYVAYECVPLDQTIEPESEIKHPCAYAASTDPDTMYHHEAMREPDREEFLKAMEKEVKAHTANENWSIVKRSQVPTGHMVMPAVWAMKRKRRISDGQVYKWKARLNLDGGKQTKGVDYWETYAPVATWSSIRMILNMAAMRGWETRQMDFVQAYPQAPVETELYMEIPKGFQVGPDKRKFVLRLNKNLYGQKQAGRVWNQYLTKGLVEKLGFIQSQHDPCVLWRGSSVMVIYTDDTIVTGPDPKELDQILFDIGSAFDITSQNAVSEFLGVKIDRQPDSGQFTLTQPHLIKSILKDLGLQDNSHSKDTPALSTKILQRHDTSTPHNEPWHYRGVIGKLNFLEKSTRPDIAYAVHQCARFCQNPKVEHTRAVKHIGRYLMATMDKGLICTPDSSSLECYCDADFSGNWDATAAEQDSSTARSRTGYVVLYGACPIIWASKLQTEIALSSTESEYIALSQGLREVIPLMGLIQELTDQGFGMDASPAKVHCKVFEDNSGALEMARTHKMRPRTKHLNIKYHHFREAVNQGRVTIHAINTLDQLADIMTKPLGHQLYSKLRKGIMGW